MWCGRTADDGTRLKIYGELHLPDGAQDAAFTHLRLPTVIMAHPFGVDGRSMDVYAQLLCDAGMVVYNVDFCGGGPRARSDGDMLHMSVETEAADLWAVVGAMAEEPFCDPGRLFLMGASQGAFVATLVACRNPHVVRALALMYPAYVLHDDARRRWGDGTELPESSDIMGCAVGRRYAADALACDPYVEMPRFSGDVLLMQGDADPIAPLAFAERAAGAFPHARLERFVGAGHGFSGDDLQRSFSCARDFFREVSVRA